jgi:hypothetical protein
VKPKPVVVRIDGDKEIEFPSADEMAEWLAGIIHEEDYDREPSKCLVVGCGRGIEVDVLPRLHGSARPLEE